MRDTLKGVWLFAVLIAAPILAIELLGWASDGRLEGFLIGNWVTMPMIAIVIAPLVWWLLVSRLPPPRLWNGIAAGALSTALVLAVATVAISIEHSHRLPRPDGGMVDAAGVVSLLIYWAVGIPLGGLFGAVAHSIQKREWMRVQNSQVPVGR